MSGDGGVCVPCGLERIRVASGGTIFFLIRPVDQVQSDDGIWRLEDTDGDGDYTEESIVKVIDSVFTDNEIWDFAIGPHDGNLYVLVAGRPPTVDRVTIYEPSVSLGDPPLGTVFHLPATHGSQNKIEFFPVD